MIAYKHLIAFRKLQNNKLFDTHELFLQNNLSQKVKSREE